MLALLFFPSLVHGKTVVIEPAGIQLERPLGAKLIGREAVKVEASNLCFPRIQSSQFGLIDCIMWNDAPSLEDALDAYVLRIKEDKYNEKGTFTEIGRIKFKADSGIDGLEYRFDLTRNGNWITHLVRYIFRNKNGKIVCLGGFGDLEQINKLVIKSLAQNP